MAELLKAIQQLTCHSAQCGGCCTLQGESHGGLAVVFTATCSKSHYHFQIHTSTYTATEGSKKWHVNLGAILGQISTQLVEEMPG